MIGRESNHFYVATAAHCVASDVTVESFGASYPQPSTLFRDVETMIEDPWLDFALLRVRGRYSGPVLTIGSPSRLPRRGDEVLSIGCGHGAAPSAEVDLLEGSNSRHWIVRQSGTPGRSGGPLISVDGFLIGCTSATDGEHTYYCYLDRMRELMDQSGLAKLYRSNVDAAIARHTPSDRDFRSQPKVSASSKQPQWVPVPQCPTCVGCPDCCQSNFDDQLAIGGRPRHGVPKTANRKYWSTPEIQFGDAIGGFWECSPPAASCQPGMGANAIEASQSQMSVEVYVNGQRIVFGDKAIVVRNGEIFINGGRVR